ncbi:MAG: ABC transporter permease [Candidatus Rokuibacteriota bacterium]|nr:MAG: ABC transporter permease [Candidatus Rokubacteria bacterium]
MVLRVVTYALIVLLLVPLAAIVATSFTTLSYVTFPPQGFTLRWYGEALHKQEFLDSFVLSLGIALVTAVLATVLGAPVAVALVRYRFAGRDLVNAFFMSPLILPTVVIGIALLQFYNRIRIGSTSASLVLGHVIVTTPYAIRLIASSLTGLDPAIERAARNLGAPPLRAFRLATLPLIRPGLMAGAVFAFITSFDNVTISIFLATPRMVTLPVRIYNLWDQPMYPWLIAICSLIILWTVILIAIVERAVSVRGLFGAAGAR